MAEKIPTDTDVIWAGRVHDYVEMGPKRHAVGRSGYRDFPGYVLMTDPATGKSGRVRADRAIIASTVEQSARQEA